MSRSSAPTTRRANAVQSFRSAADCIGEVTAGMSLFAMTRGQFSMLDAVLHVLDQVGPSKISLWTWTIAWYEVDRFRALMTDGRITGGTLIIDGAARRKNSSLIADWQSSFGPDSVRYVVNHAKIATVEGGHLKCLLRGSMNLNFNPRFEQFDLTEGGQDFDLVREIEQELPILAEDASGEAIFKGSRVAEAFNSEQLAMFRKVKVWSK